MEDLVHVSLKELQENYSDYHGKKIKISDCPYFITSELVHDYYIQMGPKGGCTVIYSKNKKHKIASYDILEAKEDEGIRYQTSTWGWDTHLGLPVRSRLPGELRVLRSSIVKNRDNYERLYQKASNRVDHIDKLLSANPEHLI